MGTNTDEQESKEKVFTVPHEVKLDHPVLWDKNEEPRDVIIVKRRTKAKDLMQLPAEKLKLGDLFKLLPKITGEPMSFIEELDGEDVFKVVEVLKSFLPKSQTTGEDS